MKLKIGMMMTGLLVLNACATNSKDAATPTSAVQVAAVKEKPEFQKGVQWELSTQARAGKCVVPAVKTPWKNLIEVADHCVLDKSWTNVEKLAALLLEQEPESAWGPYFASLAAEGRAQWPRAIWMNDLAIKRSPKTGAFVYQKARLLWKTESYREAVIASRQAVELDPDLLQAYLFTAQVLYRDHDYDAALKELTRGTQHGLRDAQAWAMMGECYVQAGGHQAAVDAFEKAVAAEPKKVDHRLRQAFIFDELLQNKSEALSRYLAVQDLIKKGGYTGKLGFNLSEKIDALKKVTAQLSAAAAAKAKEVKTESKSAAPNRSPSAGGKK